MGGKNTDMYVNTFTVFTYNNILGCWTSVIPK